MNAMIRYRSLKSRWWVVAFCLVASGSLLAQQQRQDTTSRDKQSLVVLSLGYLSDYTYMGRRAPEAASYLNWSSSYFHKSGWFVNGMVSMLLQERRADMIRLRLGYDYYPDRLSFGGSVSFSQFHDSAYVVASPVRFSANAYLGYDFDLVELYLNGGTTFSDDVDGYLRMDAERAWYPWRNFKLTLAAYAYAGTQQYYQQYMSTRGWHKGKGNGDSGVLRMSEDTRFQMLNYEAEGGVTYYRRKYRLRSVASYAIPVNPARYIVNGLSSEEQLHNFWYFAAQVLWRL